MAKKSWTPRILGTFIGFTHSVKFIVSCIITFYHLIKLSLSDLTTHDYYLSKTHKVKSIQDYSEAMPRVLPKRLFFSIEKSKGLFGAAPRILPSETTFWSLQRPRYNAIYLEYSSIWFNRTKQTVTIEPTNPNNFEYSAIQRRVCYTEDYSICLNGPTMELWAEPQVRSYSLNHQA